MSTTIQTHAEEAAGLQRIKEFETARDEWQLKYSTYPIEGPYNAELYEAFLGPRGPSVKARLLGNSAQVEVDAVYAALKEEVSERSDLLHEAPIPIAYSVFAF